jgi:hypothetical protein
MPITFGMKGSSYLCSQITGGVENAVPLHADIPRTGGWVLIYLLKILCKNIWNFPMNVFFQSFFHSRVTAVNFVLLTTPEEKITRITSP